MMTFRSMLIPQGGISWLSTWKGWILLIWLESLGVEFVALGVCIDDLIRIHASVPGLIFYLGMCV